MLRFVLVLALLTTPVVAAASSAQSQRLSDTLSRLDRGEPTPFPLDLSVDSITVVDGGFVVELGGSFGPAVDEVVEELRLETLLGAFIAADVEGGIRIRVADGRGGYRALGLPQGPVVTLDPPPVGTVPVLRPFQLPFGGALAGKRIALSAGHGWLRNDSGTWYTQRSRWSFTGCGNCRGIVEDFYSSEVYSRHVIPLLRSMGAEVVLVREPDHSTTAGRTVDDGDAGHGETGTFVQGTGGWGGDHRTSSTPNATFSFDLAPSVAGRKNVYLRWVQGADRTSDAAVEVEHAGGRSLFSVDQRKHGGFWLDLGAFWFEPGTGRVVVSNASGGKLVADAARLGGGMFTAANKPLWEMAAKSYVPWAGASGLSSLGDVGIRPAYAEQVGADAYISLHGNAAGTSPTTASGTSVYRYSCKAHADGTTSTSVTNCDSPAGSKKLTELVQTSIVNRMRAEWDPAWKDRQARVANFGEVRGLSTMPAALIEAAFFDNLDPNGTKVSDNRAMHDPRWREALAFAIAEALAKYFNAQAGVPPTRPDGLIARNLPDGTLEVVWSAVAGATGYRLQRIDDPRAGRDRAWDEGAIVSSPRVVLSDLVPGRTYAFRVSAANGNGEGFFSQAVVARFRGAVLVDNPAAEVLHVAAYDRRDAWVQEVDNDLDHAVEHAQALMGVTHADVYFDGALDEAVETGAVELDAYRLVDFAAGKDSTEHLAVSPPMQQRLRDYVEGGGALLVSGEEIAWHLGNRSTVPADRAFFNEVLGATYVADSAGAWDVAGLAGSAFAGLSARFDDGTGGVYKVHYPDVIAPVAGASVALTWPDGRAAAVLNGSVLYVGGPLEAVVPASARAALFDRMLQVLAPGLPSGDTDFDGASDACELAAGLDPLDARDGAEDLDGDGASNADECAAGTNPADPPVDQPDAGHPTDAGEPADAGETPDAGETADAGDAPDASLPDAGAETPDAGAKTPDAYVEPLPTQEMLDAVSRVQNFGCDCQSAPGSLLMLLSLGLLLRRTR